MKTNPFAQFCTASTLLVLSACGPMRTGASTGAVTAGFDPYDRPPASGVLRPGFQIKASQLDGVWTQGRAECAAEERGGGSKSYRIAIQGLKSVEVTKSYAAASCAGEPFAVVTRESSLKLGKVVGAQSLTAVDFEVVGQEEIQFDPAKIDAYNLAMTCGGAWIVGQARSTLKCKPPAQRALFTSYWTKSDLEVCSGKLTSELDGRSARRRPNEPAESNCLSRL